LGTLSGDFNPVTILNSYFPDGMVHFRDLIFRA
jgi:hypothetical protein